MASDLLAQGEALAACLGGLSLSFATSVAGDMVAPELQPFSIAARGAPDCLPVLLVRPARGPEEVTGQRCVYTSQWVIAAYWDLACGLECAQLAIYRLMSGEDTPGSITHHLKDRANLAPLMALRIGIPPRGVGPAQGFAMTPYSDGQTPNTYWAQLPVTLQFTGA